MAELLRVESISAGYGEARVIQGLSFALEDGRSLALLGRNGVGKTTLIDTLIGVTTLFDGRILLMGEDIASLRPHVRARRGVGWTPQERNIFRSLTRRGESDGGRAARRLDGQARLRALSPARGAADQHGAAIVGRRTADAGDRPRSGPEPAAPAAGRADRGARADHRRRAARGAAGTRPRRPFDDHRRTEAEEDPAVHRSGDRARPRRDRPRRDRAPNCSPIRPTLDAHLTATKKA